MDRDQWGQFIGCSHNPSTCVRGSEVEISSTRCTTRLHVLNTYITLLHRPTTTTAVASKRGSRKRHPVTNDQRMDQQPTKQQMSTRHHHDATVVFGFLVPLFRPRRSGG